MRLLLKYPVSVVDSASPMRQMQESGRCADTRVLDAFECGVIQLGYLLVVRFDLLALLSVEAFCI
jgi:hypothetical protein